MSNVVDLPDFDVTVAPSYRSGFVNWDRFLMIGRNQSGASVVDGMPWSFTYNGCPVTHENNELYLISQGGKTLRFTPEDLLVALPTGELYVLVGHRVPEEGGWFLPKSAVTDGVMSKLNTLIEDSKWCSIVDVLMHYSSARQVRFEADWIKYMVPVPTAPGGSVPESQAWVARLGMVASKFHEPSVINRVSNTEQDEIIKRLMTNLGQPDSHSLYQAFKQFANEICHGHESLLSIVQRAAQQQNTSVPDVMAPVDHDLKGNPIHSDLAKSIAARPVPIPGINTQEPLTPHQLQQKEAGKFQ
jgi:hypothetical protein